MRTSSRSHSLHPIARATRTALGLLMLPLGPLALAAPQGGVVAAGQANVSRNGNLTTVQQQSARAVIDWRSFNLSANEAIDFRQPDARAAVLNRVGGSEPSAIFGRITANGNVFIVNPNGILFGAGAQVNVGGLVASTANVSTANFMAGDYRFDQPGNPSAKVENHGTIRVADTGIAALVGRQVVNSGFIVARLGKVALAGGDTFVLDLAGDRLVNLVLGPADLEKVVDANGLPLTARVDNTGSIRAEGSLVQLSAATVSKLLDNVINVRGDVRATSVGARDGVISLSGGDSADVVVGGVVQAGRRVEVDGRNVTLAGTAQVDLGAGADLKVVSLRDTRIDVELNALRAGGSSSSSVAVSAAGALAVNRSIALDGGVLSLASGDQLRAATGVTLQTGGQPIVLRGDGGVTVDRVLTRGAVDIASAAGSVTVGSAIVAPTANASAASVGSVKVDGARGVRLSGVLADGNIELTSGGDVLLGASPLQSLRGDVRVGAGGDLIARSVSAAGVSMLVSGGTLSVVEVLGHGVAGQSQRIVVDGGTGVTLAGARAADGGISVTSRGGDVVSGGLMSSGEVRVVALDGQAGTGGAPLMLSAGAAGVTVQGRTGVNAGAVLTPGLLSLRSEAGGVTLGSVAAAAGDLGAVGPAGGLTIQADGEVVVGGARVGAAGVTIEGPEALSGAGSVRFSKGSIFSDGGVTVSSLGEVAVQAPVLATSDVSIRSSQGGLSVGQGGIHVLRPDASISLGAAGTVQLNGSLVAKAGTIRVESTSGVVAAQVSQPGLIDDANDAVLQAGTDQERSRIVVEGKLGVVLGGMQAAAGITVDSTDGDVQLLSPLGGTRTGYTLARLGYQGSAETRPDVGPLLVNALNGSVELNGLNLDGQVDPRVNANGLEIHAHRILSNAVIAVNKGNIVLAGGESAGGGVFLGDAVYSRGWDVGSTAAGSARPAGYEKIGYSIDISGRRLGLFDRTSDIASVPGLYRVTVPGATPSSVLVNSNGEVVDQDGRVQTPGQYVSYNYNTRTYAVGPIPDDLGTLAPIVGTPVLRQVGKIVIANNPANYSDSDVLVPATTLVNGGTVAIRSTEIGGVGNVAALGPGEASTRIDVKQFFPSEVALSEVDSYNGASVSGNVVGTKGLALKLLGFRADGDVSTSTDYAVVKLGAEIDALRTGTADALPTQDFLFIGGHYLQGVLERQSDGTFKVAVKVGTHSTPPPVIRDDAGNSIVLDDGDVVTYHLREVAGHSGYAEVLAIGYSESIVNRQANQAPSVRAPSTWGEYVLTATNDSSSSSTLALRAGQFISYRGAQGELLRLVAGQADLLRVNAQVRDAGGVLRGVQVAGSPTLDHAANPDSGPMRALLQYTKADGELDLLSSWSTPTINTVRTAVVDSVPVSAGITPGTRLLIFDEPLIANGARPVSDQAGGGYVPINSGVQSGANNSGTAFGGAGELRAVVGGNASGVTAVGGQGSLSGFPGVNFSAGVSIGAVIPADPGFTLQGVTDTSNANRAATDALTLPIGSGAVLGQLLQSVEWGTSPASQADLGRYRSVPGAARNVFQRSYRLASTEDGVACVPGTIAPAGGGAGEDGKPAAPSGGAVRVCAP